MAGRAIRLADGAWRIPTVGASAVNSVALVAGDGSVTLVDTGFRWGSLGRIVAGLSAIGKRPEAVTDVILTHAHADHAGGAQRLRTHTSATVHSHEVEAPDVRRGRVPARTSTLLGRLITRLTVTSFPPCPVDATFADNQLLDVAGGLRVLHTPGHTPGHCSFLHEPSGVLITGDSLFNWRWGRIWAGPKSFCSDHRLSAETADRLGEVDYDVVCFTHGPEIREHARQQVRAYLRRQR